MQIFLTNDLSQMELDADRIELCDFLMTISQYIDLFNTNFDFHEYLVQRFFLTNLSEELTNNFFSGDSISTIPNGINAEDYDDPTIPEENVLYQSYFSPVDLIYLAITMPKVIRQIKNEYVNAHFKAEDETWNGDALLYARDVALIDFFSTKVFDALRDIPQLKNEIANIYAIMTSSRESYKYVDLPYVFRMREAYEVAQSKSKRRKLLKTILNQLIHIDPSYKRRDKAIAVAEYIKDHAPIEDDDESMVSDDLMDENADDFNNYAA